MTPHPPIPASASPPLTLLWLRRDLRLHDHAALAAACATGARVALVFVFDRDILDPLLAAGATRDRRIGFILDSLAEVDAALRAAGSALLWAHARAVDAVPELARRIGASVVRANRDHEPQAIARDAEVAGRLAAMGIEFHSHDDQVVVPPSALLTGQGRPYAVFTPYRRAWVAAVRASRGDALRNRGGLVPERLLPLPAAPGLPAASALGFSPAPMPAALPAGMGGARAMLSDFLARIDDYAERRDFPGRNGTSHLSVHLRFGTCSVRELAAAAWERALAGSAGADAWLSELVWREFYAQVLFHRPDVVQRSFRPAFDRIVWDDDPEAFEAWRAGRTGYPLVDAAMRQLSSTGFMHNRLRMVVASFLCKDLGLDWRLGEAYFARELNDFDLASNNGGWQWAASSGCDAQPWFRIFNPVAQSERFDPGGRFIRRYVPELAGLPDAAIHAPWLAAASTLAAAGVRLGVDYPAPMVDHAAARARTLARYAVVRETGQPPAG